MTSTPRTFSPRVVLVAGCLIAAIGFGIRSSMGLFLEPITLEQGFSRETFGMAMAIQNLIWGLAMPFAGMLLDRHGASRVLPIGALFYALGLVGMTMSSTSALLYLSGGVLMGLGIAFTAFSLAMAAMVRVVSPERRTMVMGLGTAAGSGGQFFFSPLSLEFIRAFGWADALLWLAAITALIWPLALLLPRGEAKRAQEVVDQTIGQALREAASHRGYVLLTLGFFVCGFHLAFITVHFPAYVKDVGLDPRIGAWSIALIGLFNVAGSLSSGYAGQRWRMKWLLSGIYLARAVAIVAMLLMPKTAFNILAFAAAMGFLWLSTVPLTQGIIVQVFGLRYMATLYGIVFLSHQIGSFVGVWLGGYLYDATGSYDGMWWAGVALGIVSAMLHMPINDKALARMQPQAA